MSDHTTRQPLYDEHGIVDSVSSKRHLFVYWEDVTDETLQSLFDAIEEGDFVIEGGTPDNRQDLTPRMRQDLLAELAHRSAYDRTELAVVEAPPGPPAGRRVRQPWSSGDES